MADAPITRPHSLAQIREEVERFLRSFPAVPNPVSMAVALTAEVIEPAIYDEAMVAAKSQAENADLRKLLDDAAQIILRPEEIESYYADCVKQFRKDYGAWLAQQEQTP